MAVNTVDVATPLAFVVAVLLPAKLPLAPLAGAVNVTVTPCTGLPPLSFTVATSAAANAVLMAALCGVPPVAVIDAAVPVLTLIAFEVPVIVVVTVSVAVTVWLPAVLRVAGNVPDPLVSVEFAGREAWESVLVKCTVPE